LTVIIDQNGLQAMDFLENVLTVKGRKFDLQQKMKAFGFEVKSCDGHNPKKIVSIVERWIKAGKKLDKPQVLVANTVKGYGLLCMENVPKFHFRLPTKYELKMGRCFE
jgi:transketolase